MLPTLAGMSHDGELTPMKLAAKESEWRAVMYLEAEKQTQLLREIRGLLQIIAAQKPGR